MNLYAIQYKKSNEWHTYTVSATHWDAMWKVKDVLEELSSEDVTLPVRIFEFWTDELEK